jgi:flagellar basal body-associated protein FliL
MAKGMNWGIFSLLAVVAMVLGSVAAFFVFLARRANAQPEPELEPLLESPDPII